MVASFFGLLRVKILPVSAERHIIQNASLFTAKFPYELIIAFFALHHDERGAREAQKLNFAFTKVIMQRRIIYVQISIKLQSIIIFLMAISIIQLTASTAAQWVVKIIQTADGDELKFGSSCIYSNDKTKHCASFFRSPTERRLILWSINRDTVAHRVHQSSETFVAHISLGERAAITQ